MNEKVTELTSASESEMHVYVLPVDDCSRIKIGRSRTPLRRISSLRYIYPEIDLTRAVIVGVDDHRVEKVLHTAFGKRRQSLAGHKDGHTEWFRGDFMNEVLSLVRIIANHRETSYPEFRNVDVLLRDYLVSNPKAGLRPPRQSKAEFMERAPLVKALLAEAVLDRTQEVIDRLDEQRFDAVIRHGNRAYLARVVHRDREPECWLAEGGHRTSDWSRRLGELGLINVRVDGGSCAFHLLDLPTFVPKDVNLGTEFYLIPELRPSAANDSTDSEFSICEAFEELWVALESLPVIVSPTDPLERSTFVLNANA